MAIPRKMTAPAINLDDIRIGQGLCLRAPETFRQRVEKQANDIPMGKSRARARGLLCNPGNCTANSRLCVERSLASRQGEAEIFPGLAPYFIGRMTIIVHNQT